MNKDKLRQLIKLFEESDLEELEIQHSFWRGTRIKLGRQRQRSAASQPDIATVPSGPSPQVPASSPPLAAEQAPTAPPAGDGEGFHTIAAPMVGTFYRSSSPEEEPFVHEGDQVEPGQTLCIIEAMKIMNEIEADLKGEIVEILVGDTEPVEYNQPMMRIRPT